MARQSAPQPGPGTVADQMVEAAEAAGNQIRMPTAHQLGLGRFARRLLTQVGAVRLRLYASQLAFRALFALFPTLLALLWVLQVLDAQRLVNALVALVDTVVPEAIARLVRDQVTAAPDDQAQGALTWWALLSLLVALWALSGVFRAAMEGLNAVYGVEEHRPVWQRYLLSVALGLAVTTLVLGALALVVGGADLAAWLADRAELGVAGRWATQIAIWPVLLSFVLGATALTYAIAPAVEPRFRWLSRGSVVAALLWLLFTSLYSLYLRRFTGYHQLYGALAGIVLLMVYVYASAFILLLGAAINQVLEQSHPEGKDAGERAPGLDSSAVGHGRGEQHQDAR